jgi:hypothetical protein
LAIFYGSKDISLYIFIFLTFTTITILEASIGLASCHPGGRGITPPPPGAKTFMNLPKFEKK